MPKTLHPVTFRNLQATLNGLGYGLGRHDPDKPILHWWRENKKKFPSGDWPDHLTTLKPDFTADGHAEPVYDRSYVVDLLVNIFGDSPDGAGQRLAIVAHQIATAER
ncbi:hypothetical protein [Bradyrhizobium sp. HKCCYLR20261]|uniref:hypothetical protein n=1 Tax=Bradyrhizobium sp. HKCCYLR20261 TaxID=3420760 RepID=UPI003EBB76F8